MARNSLEEQVKELDRLMRSPETSTEDYFRYADDRLRLLQIARQRAAKEGK